MDCNSEEAGRTRHNDQLRNADSKPAAADREAPCVTGSLCGCGVVEQGARFERPADACYLDPPSSWRSCARCVFN
jgi:hypothetical protein